MPSFGWEAKFLPLEISEKVGSEAYTFRKFRGEHRVLRPVLSPYYIERPP